MWQYFFYYNSERMQEKKKVFTLTQVQLVLWSKFQKEAAKNTEKKQGWFHYDMYKDRETTKHCYHQDLNLAFANISDSLSKNFRIKKRTIFSSLVVERM